MTNGLQGPTRLVLDASTAIPLVHPEPLSAAIKRLLGEPPNDRARVLVPSFFWLEVTNVLVRRHRYEPQQVLEALAELDAVGLETVELDRPMLLLALDAVARHGLTAYDAAYLALAESTDAELVTADATLAAAAGPRARFIGGGAVRELAATYASGTWSDWPGAAAYLQELRARVASGSG